MNPRLSHPVTARVKADLSALKAVPSVEIEHYKDSRTRKQNREGYDIEWIFNQTKIYLQFHPGERHMEIIVDTKSSLAR